MMKNLLFLLTITATAGMTITTACNKVKASENPEINSVFKYREIFLPEGIGENAEALGLNTLEDDWGIWGHNLSKVLPEDFSHSIYAKQNGSTLKKQYCFSSRHLYSYIEDYIDSHYDDTEKIRFTIMPNDNDIVCLCEKCVAIGNTPTNASPAVDRLVRRLAERFPNHVFYTTDYRTTRGVTTDTMPSNTGVLVSAMDYPLSSRETPQEVKFIKRLKGWDNNTGRVLVWDYINNFDDYFTPYPTMAIMQRRLKNYRDNNVRSVFLNGSGPDMSALSRLRTEVLAALTADPEIDWRNFLTTKATELYPVTGSAIADFMLTQEDFVVEQGKEIPKYDGVKTALQTYLPEDKFIAFHDNLLSLRGQTQGAEREELDRLLGQLALTRLELKRINADLYDTRQLIEELENLAANGGESYNESGWTVNGYLRDYRYLLNHAEETANQNKLRGDTLKALTPLDPEYTDLSILTDGVLGIPSNYHNGNLITSPENFTKIALPNNPDIKKVAVWMSYNPAYRVELPEFVSLWVGEKEIKKIKPEYPTDLSGHSRLEFDIPTGITEKPVLIFYKEPETHSMAIEEIVGL